MCYFQLFLICLICVGKLQVFYLAWSFHTWNSIVSFFFIFSNLVCVLCTLYVIAYTTIPRDKKPHIYELKPKDNPFAFWCYGNNKRTNSLEILAFMFCHYFVIVYRWKVASFSLYFAFFVFFMDCIARDTIWKKLKIFYLCKTSTNVNMICQSDGNRITLYTHIM